MYFVGPPWIEGIVRLEVDKIIFVQISYIFSTFFQHGNTALHEAAWKGYSRTVELLCKNRSNYYLRNRGGFSALHLCCQNGHNESCRVILRAGCKPNIKNNVSGNYSFFQLKGHLDKHRVTTLNYTLGICQYPLAILRVIDGVPFVPFVITLLFVFV